MRYQTAKAMHRQVVPSNKRLARRLPASRGYVKRAVARTNETKAYYKNSGLLAMGYDAPIIQDMCEISTGVTSRGRDGLDIKAQSFTLKGYVTPNAGTAIVVARVMLLQWFEDTAGATPTLTDLFTATSSSYYETLAEYILLGRGKVLYDRRFVCDDVQEGHHVFTAFVSGKKLARKIIRFNESNTTGKSHIYLIGTSNVLAAGSPPALAYSGKLAFKDA